MATTFGKISSKPNPEAVISRRQKIPSTSDKRIRRKILIIVTGRGQALNPRCS
jgi:hypothetical protein